MAIKPILFNSEMVRAILDGRKTCTRRIVKTRQKDACGFYVTKNTDGSFADVYEYDDEERMFESPMKPPYQPGDLMYVRETWGEGYTEGTYIYKADDKLAELSMFEKTSRRLYHPSIHMPKEAARIWLKVTDVWVERLQKCGEGWCIDIEKEGIAPPQDPILYINDDAFHDALRMEFRKIWNSTIKKSDIDRYGWEANPWVWVIEFERCERPEEGRT